MLEETITIEKEVFQALVEKAVLFDFYVENAGRITMHVKSDGGRQGPFHVSYVLNPPGMRQQYLREDVINALNVMKYRLSVPQYGVN